MRCIEKNWTTPSIFKKVSDQECEFLQLSREMADWLIQWVLKYKELDTLIQLKDKEQQS